MNIEKIKQQKLIFKYNGDYDLSFVDEDEKSHKDSKTISMAVVDLYCLAQSCFAVPNDFIFTCSCGYPECAGIWNYSCWLTETEIFWQVNDDYFRFDRKQYVEEVKSKIDIMASIEEPKRDEDDYFASSMTKETILKLKAALENYDNLSKIEYTRYKVILCPEENKIYINENGKRIGFCNKDYIKFSATDIFGQDYCCEKWMPDLKKWAYHINHKDTIDWIKWNKQGIKQAQYIRELLPPIFDIWYRFQGEDKED